MEITPKNPVAAIEAYVNPVHVKPKNEAAEAEAVHSGGVKSDTVVISDAARRLQEAQAQIKAVPDVRSEKVAELRRQVEAGTYEIKPEKIADNMIRESLLNDIFK